MRLSRLNYDKQHRCPGWSGGGWRRGPEPSRCPGGSFASFMYERSHWNWRFTRCPQCGLLCLPFVTRWADPSWLRWYHGKRRKVYRKWPYNRA
jgi:hypothetical protein